MDHCKARRLSVTCEALGVKQQVTYSSCVLAAGEGWLHFSRQAGAVDHGENIVISFHFLLVELTGAWTLTHPLARNMANRQPRTRHDEH
jgi:hypothetical protein